MDFQEIAPYLIGEKLDVGLNFRIARPSRKILYRMDYLVAISKGKRVIHVGCVDHSQFFETKIKQNFWLHKLLCDAAEYCLGFDIDEEGLEKVIGYGYKNVLKFDIVNDKVPDSLKNEKFDLIILGEILEHVDNPVEFLTRLHGKFKNICKQIVITVPNAYFINNLVGIFRNIEKINTDHRYTFTPYTLAKVSTIAGFKVRNYELMYNFRTSRNFLLKSILFRLFPATRSTIVMTLDF